MNWDAFSAISSAVDTLAVTMSVIYLAIQVKTSTKATNSQTYQFATQALGEMASIVGVNKDLSRIFVHGMADPDSIDKEEYYQFSYLTISLFRRYENIFYQHYISLGVLLSILGSRNSNCRRLSIYSCSFK